MLQAGGCMTEIRRNLQILWNTVLNDWLSSLLRCSTDHQVCSHVHSTCDSVTEVMKIQSTTTVTSNSPKAPLQTRCASQLGKAFGLTQKRAAQHIVGVKLCKPSCLHGFSLWRSERQKHQEQKSKLPLSGDCCWQSPPVLYVHHTADRC